MKVLGIVFGLMVFIALSLAGLYVGASWYVGQKLQKNSAPVFENIKKSGDKYGATWTLKSYQRHILSSEITTQFTWSQTATPETLPSIFICQSKIHHGPFLGVTLGLFTSESSCHLDNPPEPNKSFKGVTLLTEKTSVDLSGNFKGKIQVTPFQKPWHTSDAADFIFKGCNYDFGYNIGTHLLSVQGLCHGFDFLKKEDENITQIQIENFDVSGQSFMPDLTKGFSQSKTSQTKIRIPEGIKITNHGQDFKIQTVTIEQNTEEDKTSLASGQLKLSVGQITSADLSAGPLTIDIGYDRFDLSHEKHFSGDELQTKLLNNLKNNPQLSLNKLRLEMGSDYIDFNFKLKMTPVNEPTITNPLELLNNINLLGQVELTEPFYGKVSGALGQSQSAQQIQGFKQSGFLLQEGDVLKTHFKYEQGVLSVNDKNLELPGLGHFIPQPKTSLPLPIAEPSAPRALPAEPLTEPSSPLPIPKPKSKPASNNGNFFRQDR